MRNACLHKNINTIIKVLLIFNIVALSTIAFLILREGKNVLYYGYFAVICTIYVIIFIGTYWLVFKPLDKIEAALQRFNIEHDIRLLKEIEIYCSKEANKTLSGFMSLFENVNAIKKTNINAEYRALQNQINPHFLYNTLESIRSDAISEGAENIANITEALAAFFRYTISNINSIVTLEAELSNSETYFTIQNFRFGDKIRLKINLSEEDLNVLECRIPKLTLQPIIENAIMHGLEPKIGRGTVQIDFLQVDDRLLLKIRDDGVGMPAAKLSSLNERLSEITPLSHDANTIGESNIGLINVNNRIKLEFGERHRLRVDSIENFGTCVELTLPNVKSKR